MEFELSSVFINNCGLLFLIYIFGTEKQHPDYTDSCLHFRVSKIAGSTVLTFCLHTNPQYLADVQWLKKMCRSIIKHPIELRGHFS